MKEKFKDKMIKFMRGRYGAYGMDLLNKRLQALFYISIILSLILRLMEKPTKISLTLAVVSLVLLYFRTFSKNISARARANQSYKDLESKISKPFIKLKRRVFGTKTHIYTSCPNCKTEVRLPRGKGKLKVTCPNCKQIFVKRT